MLRAFDSGSAWSLAYGSKGATCIVEKRTAEARVQISKDRGLFFFILDDGSIMQCCKLKNGNVIVSGIPEEPTYMCNLDSSVRKLLSEVDGRRVH